MNDGIDPQDLQKKLTLLSSASPEQLREALKTFDDSTRTIQALLPKPAAVPQTPFIVKEFSQTLSGGANIGMDPVDAQIPNLTGPPVPCTGVFNGVVGFCYLIGMGGPQALP